MTNAKIFWRGIELTEARINWITKFDAEHQRREILSMIHHSWCEPWGGYENYNHDRAYHNIILEIAYNLRISGWVVEFLPEFMEELRRVEG